MQENKQNMLISIIIVTKNSAQTLRKTLDSLKRQTYKHIEIIAVDGMSDDNTVEIFHEYSSLLGYFVSEPDKGIYDAMNKGIRNAHGDIIYFLNSNDFFYSDDVCAEVVKTFQEKNPLIVFGDIYFLSPSNKDIICTDYEGDKIHKYSGTENFMKLFLYGVCHQSVFYAKSLFESVGNYNLSFPIYADYDFNIRAWQFAKDRICYLDKVIAYFELGGISTNELYVEKQKNEIALIRKNYSIDYKEKTEDCNNHKEKTEDYNYLVDLRRYYLGPVQLLKVMEYSSLILYYVFGFIPLKIKKKL